MKMSRRCYVPPVLLFVLRSLICNAQPEAYTWHNVAIGGGGFVSGVVVSKTEQHLVYARTDVGGAYRWDNISNEWIPLLDWVSENELGYLGVESIATDPVEPNKVYILAGTSYFNNGKTAILRSSDYGNTFAVTDVTPLFKAHGNGMGRQTGEKLVVDPNSNGILFCGTRGNGLFKSSNAGVTWSRVTALNVTTTPNNNGISFVVPDASTSSGGTPTQTWIAGISRTGENIFRTDDGGASFSVVTGAPTVLMPQRAVLATDGDLYITYANAAGPWDISGAGQIWKYNLGTEVWTDVTPAGFTGAFGGISADPANPERLVASSVNSYQAQGNSWGDRIFLSTNGGSTWIDVIARGFDLDPNSSPWIDGHAIHWAGSIEFDPFDTKKAWVISGNGIFRTDNIDATINIWKFQVKGLEETVPLDIVSIPNGPVASVIGDYDGFRHTEVTQYAPIHLPRMGTTSGIAFAPLNPKIMLRVGEEMYYSTDMGISWTACTINGTKGSVAISADGTVFLHGPENSTTTYRSVDNGTTWTPVTGLTISGSRPLGDPLNPEKFYAYNNSSGTLLVSTNGGTSFSAAGAPGSGGSKIIRAAPFREGDIWVALYGGGLTRSTNSGQSFAKITGVSFCTAVGFGKVAPEETYPAIYIWGTINAITGIHRSVDEGITWQRVNDDAHEYGGPANGQFVIGDMNVFGRVYMSTAGRGIVYGESDLSCVPAMAIPNLQIADGEIQQTPIAALTPGETIVLSPQPSDEGTWTWTGPQDFIAGEREVTLSDLQADQSGIYTAHYTNGAGCESSPLIFVLSVQAPQVLIESITVTANSGLTTIDEPGGSLQMNAAIAPANATDPSVTWSISVNDELAAISSEGLLTAIKNGTVTVRASANDGSGILGEATIIINNQGITDIEATTDARFGIYPTPASEEIFISHASIVKEIVLLDTKGRKVMSIVNDKTEMTVPVACLPAGLYFMQITCRDKVTYLKRIVKY